MKNLLLVTAILVLIGMIAGGVLAVDKRIRDQVDDRLQPVRADIQMIRTDVQVIRAHLLGGN